MLTLHPQARRGLLLARHLAAPTLALVLTTALLLAELAYALGHQTGAAVHARSQQLAQLHVALLGLAPAMAAGDHPRANAPEPAPAVQTHQPTAAPLPTTVVALRAEARARGIRSAGGRRIAQARRADLLVVLA